MSRWLSILKLVVFMMGCRYEHYYSLQSMPVETVFMEMFVWWEAPISMKVEWRCASMTSGGQCVITCGTSLMLLLFASNWDMHTQEVSIVIIAFDKEHTNVYIP